MKPGWKILDGNHVLTCIRQAALARFPTYGRTARRGHPGHDCRSSREIAWINHRNSVSRIADWVNAKPSHFLSSLLLPWSLLIPRWVSCALLMHCASGLFRDRNAFSLAASLILRFIRQMIRVNNSASKLCADKPRHAAREFSEFSVAQLGKGQGVALPVASPPCRRTRRMETLPVSIPSGSCAAVAFASLEVLP